MNFRKSLKSISFCLFLGLSLIFLGFVIFSQKPLITLIPLISPNPLNSPTFNKVAYVIDGDTIKLENGDTVRYIGIDTPEIETNDCYAKEASKINSDLVMGKTVKLVKDVSETDKYGRLLRYVYVEDADNVGSKLVNDELVKIGAAKVMTVIPDIKFMDEFKKSENFAKENNLGLWFKCSTSLKSP